MFKLLTAILVLCCCMTTSAQPTAGFSADKAGGCGPLVVHFTNQTSGAGATGSYRWDLGNGNSSVAADPVATYTQPGSYTVVLTVQDGSQTSTASQVVTVYQPPSATFAVADPNVCLPTPVTFNATATAGSGAIANYLWDFGDGSTLTVASASTSHAYLPPGVYTVNLTVTDIYGCVATAAQSNAVRVLPALLPSFTTNPQVLCTVNSPVTFTNTTTGPGTLSYQWNFGDGNSSTAANPGYTYAAKGTYTVILTATSSAGCVAADTQTNVLNVANFQTDFTVPASVCQGAAMVFTDSSSPAPSGESWVADGAAAGTGLALTNSFTAAGNHTITLTNTYGACTQSVTRSFTVNAAPVMPPFDAVEQSACGAPMTVNFLDHTPGAVQWAWAFNYNPYSYGGYQNLTYGGPSNSYYYPENDDYLVQLTVWNAQGCQASETQTVDVVSPYAGIIVTAGTPAVCGQPMTETFGSANIPNLASWEWYFGDGDSSNAQLPTHTFSDSGHYQTYLRWTDNNGCSGISNILYTNITPPINANFSANETTVCAGQGVSFSETGIPADAVYANWDFGDGTPYADDAFSGAFHVYDTPGVYTVTLYAGTAENCAQMFVENNYITVLPRPTLSLSDSNTCVGTRGAVTFYPVTGGGATSLAWDFGDGTTQNTSASITQLVHTYTSEGNFTVNITISNGNSCSYTVTVLVYVVFRPTTLVLTGSTTTICPDGTLAVTLSATPSEALFYYPAEDVAFQYGDSTGFQGKTEITQGDDYQSYAWNLSGFQGGESGFRAITRNFLGCYDTSNFIPLAIGGAAAGFEIVQDDQCYQQPVVLQDTSGSAPGDPIVSWLWNFGDGTTSTQSGTVSHLYATPGNYPVTLTVTDQGGCAATSTSTAGQVTVNGPEALFQTQSGATTFPAGSTVQFVNNSNTTNTTNPVYTWNFGDMSGSPQVNPAHLYAVPGVYTVTLTVQDGVSGCTSTTSLVITIQPVNNAFATAASYVASGSCPPVLAQFTNTSVNYISYTWNFGDGETVSNVPDPSHVYQIPGTYIVTLTVLGDNGQTTTTVDSVVVVQPVAVLSAAVPAICVGQTVTLQSTGSQRVKSYNWDFGDGTVVSDTDSTVSHVYATAGTYQAKLVVADSLGCPAAAAATDAIDVHAPPIVGLTPPDPLVCLGKGVAIKAIGGVTYSWSPGASLNDSTIAAPVATPGVNTVYTVTVADDIGCMNSDSIGVRVVQPETEQVSSDSTAICPGKDVQITATGAYSYQWVGVVDGLSATNIPNPVARPTATTVYQVAGSDSAGCFSDTLAVIVFVLAAPTVNAGPEIDVLAETPVTIPAVGSSDVVSWQWTPPTDLSCTNCAQPVCTPMQTQQYIVTVTAADGCVASDTVVVKLLCEEAKVRIPDAFTPNGDGHNDRFTVLGAISVVNHMAIYDRWGVKVFEANHFAPADPGAGWDGTMNGQPQPPGVYVYYVEMQCPGGGVFIMKGTVVLIR
jgi:gliding motility-associated-like protein